MIKPSLWLYIKDLVNDEAEFVQIKEIILDYDGSIQQNELLWNEVESLRLIYQGQVHEESLKTKTCKDSVSSINFIEWQCEQKVKEISKLVERCRRYKTAQTVLKRLFEMHPVAHKYYKNYIEVDRHKMEYIQKECHEVESSHHYTLINDVKNDLNTFSIFKTIDTVCDAFRIEFGLLVEEAHHLRSQIDGDSKGVETCCSLKLDVKTLKELKAMKLELDTVLRGKHPCAKKSNSLPPLQTLPLEGDGKENDLPLSKLKQSRIRKTIFKALDDAANLAK